MKQRIIRGLGNILILSMISSNPCFASINSEKLLKPIYPEKLENQYKAHNSWRYTDEEKQTAKIREYVKINSDFHQNIKFQDNQNSIFQTNIGDIKVIRTDNFTSYHFIRSYSDYNKLYGYEEKFEKRVIIDYKNDGILDYMGVEIGTNEDFKRDNFPDLFKLGLNENLSDSLLKVVLEKIREINLNNYKNNKGSVYIAIRDKGIIGGVEDKLSFIELSTNSSYNEYFYDSHYNSLLKKLLSKLCEDIDSREDEDNKKDFDYSFTIK